MPDRKAGVVGALAALVLCAVAPGRAAVVPGPGQVRVIYAASVDGGSVPCCSTPAGQVAPTGSFSVHPLGKSFALDVDDVGTPDGGNVYVSLDGSIGFHGCIPVRTPRTFAALHAGEVIRVSLKAGPLWADSNTMSCPATAGVVTVTGLS